MRLLARATIMHRRRLRLVQKRLRVVADALRMRHASVNRANAKMVKTVAASRAIAKKAEAATVRTARDVAATMITSSGLRHHGIKIAGRIGD